MLFLVIVEACNLEYVFPNSAVSASGRGGTSVFSTLVLLLIQKLIFFLLSLSLLVRSLAASSRQGVRQL